MANKTKFPAPIELYHAHICFPAHTVESVQAAVDLRKKIVERYPDLFCSPLYPPVGPFIIPMLQVIVPNDPAVWGEFSAWLTLQRHPAHSILFHPVTNSHHYSEIAHIRHDHIDLAMWVGPVIPLELNFGNCMSYLENLPTAYQPVANAMGIARVHEEKKIEEILGKLSSKEQMMFAPLSSQEQMMNTKPKNKM
ncbi:hypothetical protein SmJEL517_g03873 [Synchytrium microbalum]|uniref:DOPA 4,5-dioxygenase n=1 Tax=Synchytrium microbalum TaxID=1806994 RepID=A0A507BWH6_9FUNG|nr:uncharacterized protein SmJEL517_g03873 [Synchytrium microbalum]TPX33187.1 hypothetical protein SmJEL517_g03873 [Synchytrium microbalum]